MGRHGASPGGEPGRRDRRGLWKADQGRMILFLNVRISISFFNSLSALLTETGCTLRSAAISFWLREIVMLSSLLPDVSFWALKNCFNRCFTLFLLKFSAFELTDSDFVEIVNKILCTTFISSRRRFMDFLLNFVILHCVPAIHSSLEIRLEKYNPSPKKPFLQT